MEKTIYDLQLHETLEFDSEIVLENGNTMNERFRVIRVPGGWLYGRAYSTAKKNLLFVPFNNEFKKSKPVKPKILNNF